MAHGIRRAASRGAFTLFALASLTLGACDDDVTDPSTATTVTIVSGDQQTTTAGAALAAPFVVTIDDQNGDPMSGVTVTWAITSGSGSLSATSSVSDSNGDAQSTYTAGTEAGTATVTATVSGLTALTFTVTINAAE